MIDPHVIAKFDAFDRRDSPVGNMYGTPTLIRHKGCWLLVCNNDGQCSIVRVSDTFAKAWLNEFDGNNRVARIEANIDTFASPWDADSDFDDADETDRDIRNDFMRQLDAACERILGS